MHAVALFMHGGLCVFGGGGGGRRIGRYRETEEEGNKERRLKG